MLLVTTSSKTQNPLACRYSPHTLPPFLAKSDILIEVLRRYPVTELTGLMKISSVLAEKTRRRIAEFTLPPDPKTCTRAIFTFRGEAYAALTPELYSSSQLEHAQQHLRILSGLYGILRPLDLIQPYRLEMGTRLCTGTWKNLYEFWGEDITGFLNGEEGLAPDNTVVNLASAEYSRVIVRKKLATRLITITFQEKKGDGYATIPIHSKRARGMLIHYAISNLLTEADQLLCFDQAGYRFDQRHSTPDHWLFRRGQA